jgi:hypothetical protein
VVNAVVSAAETESGLRPVSGSVIREAGGWSCRFLSTIDPRVARVKLDLLWEQGGVIMDTRNEQRVVFRKLATPPPPTGLFAFAKRFRPPESGLEVTVELPDTTNGSAEVVARGAFFGDPPEDFTRTGEKLAIRLLDGVRAELNNVEERRKHPRIPALFPLTLYPLHSDGRVDPPLRSQCQNVSGGGLALFCPAKPTAKYAYVVFDEVPGTAGLAILFQITRAEWKQDEVLVSGRFRLDLGPSE